MQIPEFIARISYSRWVRESTRRLRLGRVMQRAYALARGNRHTLRLDLNGVEGLFSAETSAELRVVERSVLLSEHVILKTVQEALKPGDVFLDVGSNLGIFTIFGAKKVGPQGTVIACEPGADAFQRLEKNTRLNQLRNVRLMRVALSDTCSVKRLVVGDAAGFGHTAHLSDADGPFEEVQTVDYDSLVAHGGFPVPRVVKMDIEGHEYAALKGMQRTLSDPTCVALFCEVHPYALPSGVSVGDAVDLIRSFGFECASRMRDAEQQVTAMKHAVGNVIGQRRGSHAHVAG